MIPYILTNNDNLFNGNKEDFIIYLPIYLYVFDQPIKFIYENEGV